MPVLGETIEVSLVNIDVVVTDRDGKRVRGLRAADFEIYENGERQPVSHFAEYAEAPADASTPAASSPPPQKRTIVLFLEAFKLQNFRVDPFIASVKQFVRDTIRPGDTVTLIGFDGHARVRVPPTGDVAAIERELDVMRNEFIGPTFDGSGAVAHELEQLKKFEATGGSAAMARGVQRTRPSDGSIANTVARSWAMRAKLEMSRRIGAINAAINALAGIEGKKVMLLAAHRLGAFAGAEYYFAAGAPYMPPGDSDHLNNVDEVRRIIANANAAGVAVYPVFPAGLDQTPIDPGVPDRTRDVLINEMATRTELAEKTGGLTTYGTAEIVKLLPSVADDVSDYYSLAYRATTQRQDEARNIVVKTVDETLRVRSRRQFVDKSDDSRMRDRVTAALIGSWRDSPLPIAAAIDVATKRRRNRRSVPLVVRIPIGALTLVPRERAHQGAFSVYVVAGGPHGHASDVTRKTQTFDIPAKDLARATSSHFTYALDVVVDDRAEYAAVGVLDEVSKSYGVTRVSLK